MHPCTAATESWVAAGGAEDAVTGLAVGTGVPGTGAVLFSRAGSLVAVAAPPPPPGATVTLRPFAEQCAWVELTPQVAVCPPEETLKLPRFPHPARTAAPSRGTPAMAASFAVLIS